MIGESGSENLTDARRRASCARPGANERRLDMLEKQAQPADLAD
jgi:hypothetical protein